MADGSAGLRVELYDNPMDERARLFEVEGGQTILAIVGGRRDLPAVIEADGAIVDRDAWAEVVPLRTVRILRAPQGDAGRILGTLAIIAFAAWAGPAAAGALGYATGTTGFAIASAAVTATTTVVGSMTLHALIPPKIPNPNDGPGGSVQRLASLNALSNRVAPFAPIPTLYGRRTFFPPIPMTGLPYTELVGSDQYLRALFVLGYGKMDIGGKLVGPGRSVITEADFLSGDPITIGGTSIDQFEDVEYEIGECTDLDLYSDSVTEQTVNVSLNETGSATSEEQTRTDGNSVTRTTETDAEEFSVELFAPALFTVSDDGDTVWAGVTFKVEYAVAGSGSWTTAVAAWEVRQRERKPVRVGRRFLLPTRGEYDVRVTRVQTYYQRIAATQTDFTWTVLRSINRDRRPFAVDGVTCMAVRIRATDQLSGTLDQLAITATRRLETWTGSVWSEADTRNPAWAYVDMLTGLGTRNPKALADVDGDALKSWADFCDTNGLYFDDYITTQATTFDRIQEAAAAGLGSWAIQDDGTIGVVRDIPGQTPAMLISPRTAAGFAMEKRYVRVPHALRVQFLDDATGEPVERIVYDDGYSAGTATRFEQLQVRGVTDSDQAWKLGRYFLAAARLRPESYRWTHDLQHLVYQRGDLVEITHDTILVGIGFARLAAVSGADVTLDDPVTLESGKSYAVRHQAAATGAMVTRTVSSPASGTVSTLTLSSAIPDAGPGDHITVGISSAVTLTARISAIRPSGDLRADVEAVPAAEDIFDAWSGAIPAWDPVITSPVDDELRAPAAPTIREVISGTRVGGKGIGRPQSELVRVEVDIPPGLVGVTLEGRYRLTEWLSNESERYRGPWRIFGSRTPSDRGALDLFELEATQEIDVEVRAVRGGRFSPWSSTVNHTIESSQRMEVGELEDPTGITNQALNGGFEAGSVGWDLGSAGAVELSSEARTGSRAGVIRNGNSFSNITREIPCGLGDKLILQSFIKKEAGPGGGRVRISMYDAGGSFVKSRTGNTVTASSYEESRVVFTVDDPDIVEARMRCLQADGSVNSTTVLWVDDVVYGIVPRDVDAEIDTPQIVLNAVTVPVFDEYTGPDIVGDNTYDTVAEVTATVSVSTPVLLWWFIEQKGQTSNPSAYDFKIERIDGAVTTVLLERAGLNTIQDYSSGAYEDDVSAGTYTYRLSWKGVDSAAELYEAGLLAQASQR